MTVRAGRPARRHRRDPAHRGSRSPTKVARARGTHHGRLRGPAADPRVGAQGLAAVHGRPDARHRPAAPHRPHGGQLVRRQRDRVVRPRAHPQGPVGEHRGRGRPDRRGHHRHRPDPQLPDPLPARQEPARRCGSARCSTSRPVASSRSRSTTSGSQIPDQFVVGYGLDYGEVYRNLRFVGVLKPEVYGAGAGQEEAVEA